MSIKINKPFKSPCCNADLVVQETVSTAGMLIRLFCWKCSQAYEVEAVEELRKARNLKKLKPEHLFKLEKIDKAWKRKDGTKIPLYLSIDKE